MSNSQQPPNNGRPINLIIAFARLAEMQRRFELTKRQLQPQLVLSKDAAMRQTATRNLVGTWSTCVFKPEALNGAE